MNKLGALLLLCGLASTLWAAPETSLAPQKGTNYWLIDVGLFRATKDLKDAGVDTGFLGSVNYVFGGIPENNGEWYLGLAGLTGNGDDDFKFRAFGGHIGVLIGFGKPGEANPWALDLRAGWYQAHLEYRLMAKGATKEDVTESGFGWFAGIAYKTPSGPRFTLGYFTSSKVKGERGTGYYLTAGFPIKQP